MKHEFSIKQSWITDNSNWYYVDRSNTKACVSTFVSTFHIISLYQDGFY